MKEEKINSENKLKNMSFANNSICIIMRCRCARKQMINQRVRMRDPFKKASSLGWAGYGMFHLVVALSAACSIAN